MHIHCFVFLYDKTFNVSTVIALFFCMPRPSMCAQPLLCFSVCKGLHCVHRHCFVFLYAKAFNVCTVIALFSCMLRPSIFVHSHCFLLKLLLLRTNSFHLNLRASQKKCNKECWDVSSEALNPLWVQDVSTKDLKS